MKILNKIIVIFMLSSCGYSPIHYSGNSDFSIIEIATDNKNQITTEIKNGLKPYKNLVGKSRFYELKISGKTQKISIAKDTRGNVKTYEMKSSLKLQIYENDEIIKTKEFVESFSYTNENNKFKLRKYENTIKKNLINKILENLILELYTL